jgi:hypothetical protein
VLPLENKSDRVFREINAVYCANFTEHVNSTLRWQDAEFVALQRAVTIISTTLYGVKWFLAWGTLTASFNDAYRRKKQEV